MLKLGTIVFFATIFLSWSYVHKSNAQGQNPVLKQKTYLDIDQGLIAEDVRLMKHISINHQNVTVNQLLQEIRIVSGIRVYAGARDNSGTENVAIFCRDIPIYKILNGIWSLFSTRSDQWIWHRSGMANDYVYTLNQPLSALKARLAIKSAIQNRLVEGVHKLINVVDSPDDIRNPVLLEMYGGKIEDFKQFNTFSPERVWADIRSLRDVLTPEQLLDVLRGGEEITAPFSRVSGQAKEFYLAANIEVKATNAENLPMPDTIHFTPEKYRGIPCLSVSVSYATNHTVSIGGGAQEIRNFARRMQDIWMMESDAHKNAIDERIMELPSASDIVIKQLPTSEDGRTTDTEPTPIDPMFAQLTNKLEQLSEGIQAPLIFRLPQDEVTIAFPPISQISFDEYRVKKLWNRFLIYKWHDGVKLMAFSNWALEDPPVSNEVLDAINKNLQPGTLFPIEALSKIADLLSRDQINRLRNSYPVMAELAKIPPVFALFHRIPGLLIDARTAGGALLTADVINSMRDIFPGKLIKMLDDGLGTSIKLNVDSIVPDASDTSWVRLMIMGNMGQPIYTVNFANRRQPMPPKKSKRTESPSQPIQ